MPDAKIQFFEENPTGRILNRFGRDTNTIDDNLPFMINIVKYEISCFMPETLLA